MKTILITGANRGLGFEFTKRLANKGNSIIACCRKPEAAKALQDLAKMNNNISIEVLDIAEQDQIDALANKLKGQPIDWLINNAGIYGDREKQELGKIDRDQFMEVMTVNCLGTLKFSEALIPNLKIADEGLIITISSAMGSITDSSGGKYTYRASKTALNCVMRALALDVQEEGINVILFHPGWVQTDMGGNSAFISAEVSAEGMLKEIEKRKADTHAEVLCRFDGDTMAW